MNVSNDQLREFIENQSLVSIRRDRIDSRSLQAVPISYSQTLVLVQYIYDFRLDGQLILRRDDITSMENRETDRFQRKLLEENALFEHIDFDFTASLTSFRHVLTSQPARTIAILEKEDLDTSEFWIGRIVNARKDTIRLHEFTGAANWFEEPTVIDQSDVTCCQLNTNYINFYARYFDAHPEKDLKRA